MKNILKTLAVALVALAGHAQADSLALGSSSPGVALVPSNFEIGFVKEGDPCVNFQTGDIGMSEDGLILSCQSGTWRTIVASGASDWFRIRHPSQDLWAYGRFDTSFRIFTGKMTCSRPHPFAEQCGSGPFRYVGNTTLSAAYSTLWNTRYWGHPWVGGSWSVPSDIVVEGPL